MINSRKYFMAEKMIHRILIITFLVLLTPTLLLSAEFPQKTSISEKIDLSTPEKTLHIFIRAFKSGNNELLDIVLAEDASIPEFNAIQQIRCPSPEITGFEIKKIRTITKEEPDTSYFQVGDVEVYMLVTKDKTLLAPEPQCKILNDIPLKGVYLLRSFGSKWKIVNAVPFWPEEIEKLRE